MHCIGQGVHTMAPLYHLLTGVSSSPPACRGLRISRCHHTRRPMQSLAVDGTEISWAVSTCWRTLAPSDLDAGHGLVLWSAFFSPCAWANLTCLPGLCY